VAGDPREPALTLVASRCGAECATGLHLDHRRRSLVASRRGAELAACSGIMAAACVRLRVSEARRWDCPEGADIAPLSGAAESAQVGLRKRDCASGAVQAGLSGAAESAHSKSRAVHGVTTP
jgi:hypothetical protein